MIQWVSISTLGVHFGTPKNILIQDIKLKIYVVIQKCKDYKNMKNIFFLNELKLYRKIFSKKLILFEILNVRR